MNLEAGVFGIVQQGADTPPKLQGFRFLRFAVQQRQGWAIRLDCLKMGNIRASMVTLKPQGGLAASRHLSIDVEGLAREMA